MNGRTNVKTWLVMAVIFLGLGCTTAVGDIIYVDVDASGANNGTSWEDAFNYLQDARADAQYGDEIWVAEGVYKPDQDAAHPNGSGSRNATFQLKNGVVIKGGYAGFGEPDPDARDFELYETILSGDLNGDDGPDFANNGENSYHVVTGNGTNATAVLDGFTITAGNANGSLLNDKLGGGMVNISGSPTVNNCVFTENSADSGGGIRTWNSSMTLTNCTFNNNSALDGGGIFTHLGSPILVNCTFSGNTSAGAGGGIHNVENSPTLTNCTFIGNSAQGGGGMFNNLSSSPTLTNCTFSDNWAEHGGGMNNLNESSPTVTTCTFIGNWAVWGGGMHNGQYSSPTLTDCTFSGNSAAWGGGINNGQYSNPTLTDCTFSGNSAEAGGGMFSYQSDPTVTNCTFTSNSAEWDGGGMFNGLGSNAMLTNCTFSGNSARWGGGMFSYQCSPTVVNCIFSGNPAEAGGGMFNHQSDPTVTNCTFSENWAEWDGGGMYNWDHSSPTVTNCILWGNTAQNGPQICNGWASSTAVSYSCVQGYVEPTEPAIQGLIAHWKFDEGQGDMAYDSFGDNHGTVYGAQWTTGKAGGALSFDGLDDYVDVAHSSDFDIETSFTVELWFKANPTQLSPDGLFAVIDKSHRSTESPPHWSGWVMQGRADIHGRLWFGIGNGTDFPGVETNENILDDVWHHIASVFDGTNVKLYLDGVLEDSTVFSGTPAGNTDPLNIGRWATGATRNFHGLIDEVRIYDQALSAEEVEQLYQYGSSQGNIDADPCFVGLTYGGPIESLISHWKLDEDQGTTAYDSAGGNHGTLINAPIWTTGQVGGALSFDGINDYVDVGNLGLNSEFTVMGWMYYYAQEMDEPIFGSDSPGEGRRISLRSNAFEVTPDGVGWNDRNHVEFQPISAGIWHHLVGVYNGSQIEVFIDGISMGTHSASSGALDPNPNNYIGRHAAGHNWYMDGLIDDVRIYNQALSAEEIQQLCQMDYHLLPGSPCIDAGDNTAVPGGVMTDIDGAPRFVDDPYTVDTGNGTPPIVDMGAYEHLRPPISIYVDEDAPGPIHDGLGWADAFNHLQDALAVAIPGDEIRVAEGIYKPDEDTAHPDGSGDRDTTFQLKNGVAIYGGYAGYGEPDPNERDVELYETVLSGDLNGDDGPDFANNGENSYHVVTGSGTDATAVLDGFTITGGNADGDYPHYGGGGMYNRDGSSPTVTNCTFSGNSAEYYGGGMCNQDNSSPTLTNCTFSGNRADYIGGGMYNAGGSPAVINCTFSENSAGQDGGGINNVNSNPTITNCTFSRNSAVGNDGGGMNNYSNSSPTITNCTFNGNSAYDWGGAIRNVYSSSPTITNCTFTGNSADDGGGMFNYSSSSPTLVNCTFTGNEARYGGGMGNRSSSSPTLTNCTFSGNSANQGGGMYNFWYSSPTLTNCILWGNTAPSGPQIYNDGTSSATVSYSCVQGYVEPTEPPTQGLIAHWRFDEGGGTVAYDSFGDNHGTLINGPEWTSGQIGDALSFDGVDDYVDCGDDTGFSFDSGDTITIEAWIKRMSSPIYSTIVGRRDTGLNQNYRFGFDNSRLSFWYLSTNGNWVSWVSSDDYSENTFLHIAVSYTFGSGSSMKMYINGGAISGNWTRGDGNEQPVTGQFSLSIGTAGAYDHFYFDGIIDDVRIYDRALSAEEVEQLYEYGLNQGNIDADPRFLDVSNGDLRLLPTSPCIDAGANTAVPAGVTTDLGGNLRFVDQPEVPDTGNGTAPIVDMGAFEADYIQAQMEFTPKVLNPKSKGKWIKAHLVLPEGFVVEDVNTNSPARIVEPFIADSNYMEVFLNEDGLVEILAAFDRADFCSNGSAHGDIVVIAQLTTGQYFYGTDTIRIKTNNLEYLAVLTSYWLRTDCSNPHWCEGSDINQDGTVDFIDFALFDGCCIEVIEK